MSDAYWGALEAVSNMQPRLVTKNGDYVETDRPHLIVYSNDNSGWDGMRSLWVPAFVAVVSFFMIAPFLHHVLFYVYNAITGLGVEP